MALTNNTKFRRTTLTINKKVNGVLETANGFPVTVSILNGFTDPSDGQVYATLTSNDFAVLNDGQYGVRLNAFYNYLEATYGYFLRANVSNSASGTNATLCPLSNEAAPAVTLAQNPTVSIEPVYGGTLDDHLTWFIQLTAPAPQDVLYYFDADIKDKNGNILRTVRLNGTIRQGSVSHDSYADDGQAIYLSEAYDSLLSPLDATYVLGSVDLSI